MVPVLECAPSRKRGTYQEIITIDWDSAEPQRKRQGFALSHQSQFPATRIPFPFLSFLSLSSFIEMYWHGTRIFEQSHRAGRGQQWEGLREGHPGQEETQMCENSSGTRLAALAGRKKLGEEWHLIRHLQMWKWKHIFFAAGDNAENLHFVLIWPHLHNAYYRESFRYCLIISFLLLIARLRKY